jgi:hypothetical protein
LLKPGSPPDDDQFVEVHIWGPMSRWTFARVILSRPAGTLAKARVKALRVQLAKARIALEEN